jgi:single-strand DNA-binding protein
MANLNKVMLIGRLTRDPEAIAGGKGAKFGFAVNNRKKNADTQQWEDVPVFIDMEIWNFSETSRPADRLLQTVRKGQQLFIEGHLRLDTWDDKNGGGKRTKLCVVVENFQYFEPNTRGENGGGGEPMARAPRPAAAPNRAPTPAPAAYTRSNDNFDDEQPDMGGPRRQGGGGGNEDDIPF